MFLKKICTENQNTHFRFNNVPSENAAIYELTWGKKYGSARQAADDNIMRRRKDEIFMPDIYGKVTGTHSQLLILIAS